MHIYEGKGNASGMLQKMRRCNTRAAARMYAERDAPFGIGAGLELGAFLVGEADREILTHARSVAAERRAAGKVRPLAFLGKRLRARYFFERARAAPDRGHSAGKDPFSPRAG